MKKLQLILDKLLPWRVRIRALELEVMRLNVSVEVRNEQLAIERKEAAKLKVAHETNKRGTSVLLQVLTRTARLNVPTTEGSIREAMQKEMTQ